MATTPTLLYLHGVGKRDDQEPWRAALDASLQEIGFPGLGEVNVVAPKYPNALRGVDERLDIPDITVKSLRGDAAARHRLEFERRRTAMEATLGADSAGAGLPGAARIAAIAPRLPYFEQARNYVEDRHVRAWVLQQIVDSVPRSGRLVIIGHSLGSVIAADVLHRLPAETSVVGMVTVGSPLAHAPFQIDQLLTQLAEPPAHLAWWVNFWSVTDPITAGRGVSGAIPWVLDQQLTGQGPTGAHDSATYLSNRRVAAAVARGLFGSKSRALVPFTTTADPRLDIAETAALLGLRFAHLIHRELDGETRNRYSDGLRQVQAKTVEQVISRNSAEGRPVPTSIATLAVDLSDPSARADEPATPTHLSMSEAVVPLVALAAINILRPFEIEIPESKERAAMKALTLDMGLGARLGDDIFDALDDARDALDGSLKWLKWTAIGLGMAAVAVATGGLVFAATPGLVGAAAITSALAAFGPGGMIGGLLTAGALVTAGGGSIAAGLAGVGTSAATVEAVVTAQLATALLRKKRGLPQDPQTWMSLTELEVEVAKELARLRTVSDRSAPTVKELERKLTAIKRALAHLQKGEMGPTPQQLEAGDE